MQAAKQQQCRVSLSSDTDFLYSEMLAAITTCCKVWAAALTFAVICFPPQPFAPLGAKTKPQPCLPTSQMIKGVDTTAHLDAHCFTVNNLCFLYNCFLPLLFPLTQQTNPNYTRPFQRALGPFSAKDV